MTHARRSEYTNAIRETWLSKMPVDVLVLYVYGGNKGDRPVLKDQNLYLCCEDQYEKLTIKTCEFLRFCQEKFDFDYLFKIDDDSYVNKTSLLGYEPQGADYAGFFKQWGKQEAETYAAGYCYLLSRKAVSVILERKEEPLQWERSGRKSFEDVMIGVFIFEFNQNNPSSLKLENWKKRKRPPGRFCSPHVINPTGPQGIRSRYHFRFFDWIEAELIEKRTFLGRIKRRIFKIPVKR